MKKNRSFFIIMLCSLVSLSSCDKEELVVNKLLGTWELISTITYYSDGTIEGEYTSKTCWEHYTFTDKHLEYSSYDADSYDITKVEYSCDGETIYFLLGGLLPLTWEIEELTNVNLKIKEPPIDGFPYYTIREFKKIK